MRKALFEGALAVAAIVFIVAAWRNGAEPLTVFGVLVAVAAVRSLAAGALAARGRDGADPGRSSAEGHYLAGTGALLLAAAFLLFARLPLPLFGLLAAAGAVLWMVGLLRGRDAGGELATGGPPSFDADG